MWIASVAHRSLNGEQKSVIIYAIDVEGIVEPAQGLDLEIDKALDEEAVDTRNLLHQLNALDDEAAVTSHILGQPNNVLHDQAAVTSRLLDQFSDRLDDETHYARSRHKILAAAT